jgi:hypothetical protein
VKRGVFNIFGEVSKIRFGTVDCDAHCYNEQIELLQQNTESVTDHLNEQLCVVKFY